MTFMCRLAPLAGFLKIHFTFGDDVFPPGTERLRWLVEGSSMYYLLLSDTLWTTEEAIMDSLVGTAAATSVYYVSYAQLVQHSQTQFRFQPVVANRQLSSGTAPISILVLLLGRICTTQMAGMMTYT